MGSLDEYTRFHAQYIRSERPSLEPDRYATIVLALADRFPVVTARDFLETLTEP
jgi:hypothetical protein